MQVDKDHVRPSVAIDKDGFIHVTGNMHNDTWCYYISNSPNNITNGFTRVSSNSILGREISYPEFYKDKADVLYITFRHKVNDSPERKAGGVMRYNTGSKTFTMLGGTMNGYDKTLVVANAAGCDGHYQKPSVRLHFDRKNRMHLVATLIAQSTNTSSANGGCDRQNSHVLYAYSDDGGQTFHKANGSIISSLPLTPNNMDVVLYSGNNDIVSDVRVGAFSTGTSNSKTWPVISCRKIGNGNTFLKKWNESSNAWITVKNANGTVIPGSYRYILSDAGGYGTTVFFRPDTNNGGYITRDGGSTFTKFEIDLPSSTIFTVSLDEEYFQATHDLRLQYASKNSGGDTTLYLIKRSLQNIGQRTAVSSKQQHVGDEDTMPSSEEVFSVFPNPNSNGHLTIKGASLDRTQLYLYDFLGHKVPFTTHSTENESVEVQVGNVSPGMFLLTVVQEDGSTQRHKILLK